MKTLVKPDLESNTFASVEKFTFLSDSEIIKVDIKFYQKLFIILISLSSILIFPESPRELENICQNHHSRKLCSVW